MNKRRRFKQKRRALTRKHPAFNELLDINNAIWELTRKYFQKGSAK